MYCLDMLFILVGAAVGVGAGVGASVAFTDPAGNCNTQAVSSGQGLTAAFGPATASVNGAQGGSAGCAGIAKWCSQIPSNSWKIVLSILSVPNSTLCGPIMISGASFLQRMQLQQV